MTLEELNSIAICNNLLPNLPREVVDKPIDELRERMVSGKQSGCDIFGKLSEITRKWRRGQGSSSSACMRINEANQLKNEARLVLIEDLEAFVESNR